MGYKPKVIIGKVKGTGYPIDGHNLYFSQWDYDDYSCWHLYEWDETDDEAVMTTMYQAETKVGFCCSKSLQDFAEKWKKGEWQPFAACCLNLDQVEVLEVVHEEEK